MGLLRAQGSNPDGSHATDQLTIPSLLSKAEELQFGTLGPTGKDLPLQRV